MFSRKAQLLAAVVVSSIISAYGEEPAVPAPPVAAPAIQAPPPNLPYIKFDLGPGGLIANWLVLGYMPGIVPPDTNGLDSVGGEEKIAPYGGENVTLKGAGDKGVDLSLTWKSIKAEKVEIPYYVIASKGLWLFVDENGKALPNCTAYAYSELESPEDQNLALKISGGEPIRIWLNGEAVPVLDRQRHGITPWPDVASSSLQLKKGINRLLVRISNHWDSEFISMRLTDQAGEPAKSIKTCLKQVKDCPEMPYKYIAQDWNAVIGEIPPVPKSEDEQFFGANLSRTMTLLETGGQTKRPVRILFYGQSITAQEWVWLLIRRLRERYPNTEIQAENYAIGGWELGKLNCTIKHDILRARPDLVVLHAYAGGSWDWERIIQKIRRETTAEIMVKSAHIGNGMVKITPNKTIDELSVEDSESTILRRLSRKYGLEYVECRREWLAYLKENKMVAMDVLADGIHLNRKGCVLMAQLYERHFTTYPISQPWFKTVRRYEAMRPLADRASDEIQLIGDGWKDEVYCATSTGKEDMLKLKFFGNRVDLVMPQCWGKAKVLIDGKPLSEWNLFHGTRPGSKGEVPGWLMTYYMGENMLEEDWELKFTHVSGDYNNYRFTVTGSKTGYDGEGDNTKLFVSNSGRITIKPFIWNDFNPNWNIRAKVDKTKTELEPVKEDLRIMWSVKRLYPDEVVGIPAQKGEEWRPRFDHPYRYVTVVDGLPQGEHELTLIPVFSERKEYFAIDAVEVHCPPLWERKGE